MNFVRPQGWLAYMTIGIVCACVAAAMQSSIAIGVVTQVAGWSSVLIGLGISSLSMATNAIPAVGVQLGKVTMDQCREVAARVVEARNSRDAKELARTALM